ncbi:FAD binding domain-containing protein [Amanita rubescens]|nr:FAD binding domain-containing protein [Amanita rubescens]
MFLRHFLHSQILVIGGGPAGSYAATTLAREGFQVTLFEAAKFPRYHVGESLIPSIRHYLRFIGAEDKLANYGFVRKPGSAIKFNQYKREGYTDFIALGHNNNAWNVIRSDFDQMLLNHARFCGVSVYERTMVESISFSEKDPTKPTFVSWSHKSPPTPLSPPSTPSHSPCRPCTELTGDSTAPIRGITKFSHLIDATGRAGIMSTKYLKNRRFNASLRNVAVWGYWSDVGVYGKGTSREGAPWFEALTDESGWAWFIPLHNGTTSIGVVMNERMYAEIAKKALFPSPFVFERMPHPHASSMASRYISALSLAPGLVDLVNPHGKLVQGSIRSASDFSYSAPSYAGNGYRIIGDAGAFIDPFFSSGIHLAFTSALSAASSICASIRGHCSELRAAEWHSRRVATSYTRFQVVVLSAYKQIRAQNVDVLSDISEDNYDRAFAFLRPVIQGASDMGTRLSESELQKSLDFCVNLFNPTSPEQHERLSRSGRIGKELLDVTAPVMDPVMLESALRVGQKSSNTCYVESEDSELSSDSERASEVRMILRKINARRIVQSEYAINNFELEPLDGYVARLETGKLGLVRVAMLSNS